MEVKQLQSIVSSVRGRLALGATLALFAGAFALPGVASAGQVCKGSIKAGEADTLGLQDNPVAYRLACSEPITSYSIITSNHELDTFETEIFGVSRTDGNVIPTDAFSCNGLIPGYGINCVGTYGGGYDVLSGTFNMSTDKLCDEPRLEPTLVVSNASYAKNPDGTFKPDKNGNPTVTTITNGPFSLGRPHGCPKSSTPGRKKIPKSNDTPAPDQGDPVTAPVRRRHA